MNDILNTLGDIQRRLRRLEALGERPVTSTLDGSGTAGQLATWVTATTLQANTPASLSLTKYTGVGTAGNLVSWASNGTVQDAGVTTAQLVSTNAANTFAALQTAQLADATTLYSVGSVTSMLALRNSANQSNTSAGVQFRVGNSSDTEQQAYVGFVSVGGTPSPKFIVRISTGTASYAEYLSIAPGGLTTVNALTVSGSLSVGGTIRAADTGGLRVMDSGGTLGVYVKNGGDVGIGTATTASGYRLTVNGSLSVGGTIAASTSLLAPTVAGGASASNDLTLVSTTHATKGKVLVDDDLTLNASNVYRHGTMSERYIFRNGSVESGATLVRVSISGTYRAYYVRVIYVERFTAGTQRRQAIAEFALLKSGSNSATYVDRTTSNGTNRTLTATTDTTNGYVNIVLQDTTPANVAAGAEHTVVVEIVAATISTTFGATVTYAP